MTRRRMVILVSALVTGVVIFSVDLLAPRGFAIGGLYVVALLLSFWSTHRRDVFFIAGFYTVLTVIGYALSPQGEGRWAIPNRSIAVLALWAAALFILRRKQWEDGMESSVALLESVVAKLLRSRQRSDHETEQKSPRGRSWKGFWGT